MTERRERAVAFVVARLSSSRLPAKQLRHIGPKSMLDWIMGALADCEELDEIVLTTVVEDENRPLRDLAESRGWPCFWYEGDVDDVVGRLMAAARHYDAEVCLLISADCPLIDGDAVDELVRQLRASPGSDVVVVPGGAAGACLLEGVHVARRRAWEAADAMSDRPELREHQFPVIYANPERFPHLEVALDASLYGPRHRMSVDTWADLEFMRTLHARLQADRSVFGLAEAVGLLAREPGLRQLNAHVHQRALVERPHKVLFIVDAGGEFGFGHLMRCRELGAQLVERLGWPVSFLLDDVDARALVLDVGFRAMQGALGRPVRSMQGSEAAVEPSAAAARNDLVILDLSARRALTPGWRAGLSRDCPVVVVDREDATAAEADLVVNPGVTGRPSADRASLPPVLAGLDYVILRREVRRYQNLGLNKDIDLLVYLGDERRQTQVRALADRKPWRVELVTRFCDRFPEQLARSRAFLSGYGQGFYEALALGCHPVAWPLSPLHRADAVAFYRATGIAATLVDDVDRLEASIGTALRQGDVALPDLQDGTPKIVARLAALCDAWHCESGDAS
jgi:spore coat polysaccharide biosynthesis protein SpsF